MPDGVRNPIRIDRLTPLSDTFGITEAIMAMVDQLLSKLGSNVDVQAISQRVGLPPDKIESAITALGAAHGQQGDTVQNAADRTGIEPGKIEQIVQQLGGEAQLSKISSFLGQSGAGNLTEKASGFFGGKE